MNQLMLAWCHTSWRGQKNLNQIVASSYKCVAHILAFFSSVLNSSTMSYIWNLWYVATITTLNSHVMPHIWYLWFVSTITIWNYIPMLYIWKLWFVCRYFVHDDLHYGIKCNPYIEHMHPCHGPVTTSILLRDET